MPKYQFWSHGVNTFVQFPKRTLQTAEPNLGIEHTGMGTRIRQNGSDNWLHIPIPTPTTIEGDHSIHIKGARVLLTVNKNAEVQQLQLLVNGNSIFTKNQSVSDDFIQLDLEPPPFEINGGLAVTVFVKFKSGTPTGEISIHGAAATFDTSPV